LRPVERSPGLATVELQAVMLVAGLRSSAAARSVAKYRSRAWEKATQSPGKGRERAVSPSRAVIPLPPPGRDRQAAGFEVFAEGVGAAIRRVRGDGKDHDVFRRARKTRRNAVKFGAGRGVLRSGVGTARVRRRTSRTSWATRSRWMRERSFNSDGGVCMAGSFCGLRGSGCTVEGAGYATVTETTYAAEERISV
jgi:hypothetical protein